MPIDSLPSFPRIVAATLVSALAACSNEPAAPPPSPMTGTPYADVTFSTTEAALTGSHPEVACKQMPNPAIRMCRAKQQGGDDVTFLFYNHELININGTTKQ